MSNTIYPPFEQLLAQLQALLAGIEANLSLLAAMAVGDEQGAQVAVVAEQTFVGAVEEVLFLTGQGARDLVEILQELDATLALEQQDQVATALHQFEELLARWNALAACLQGIHALRVPWH